MPTVEQWQEAGRKTKAFKLAQILRTARISSEEAGLMTEGEWIEVARHAGQKPPSEITIRYTIERLAEFERAPEEAFA